MTGLVDLPEEILEGIIDELNTSSQKSICLVSRTFLVLGQQALFRFVDLSYDVKKEYNPTQTPAFCANLLSVFTTNPTLINYVRNITVSQAGTFELEEDIEDDANFLTFKGWIRDHSCIVAELLELLASAPIQTFSLTSIPVVLIWSQMEQRFRDVLLAIFRKPTLEELVLNGVTLPSYLFPGALGPNIQTLNLFIPFIDRSVPLDDPQLIAEGDLFENGCSSSLLPPMRISQLILHYVCLWEEFNRIQDLDLHFIGPEMGVDLSKVESLGLNLVQYTPSLDRFIQSKVLKKLLLVRSYIDPSDPDWYLDISPLESVSKLGFCRLCAAGLDADAFGWVDNALTTLPLPHPTLNEIVIGLDTDFEVIYQEEFPYMATFFNTLSRFQNSSNGTLKRIEIHIWFSEAKLKKEEIEQNRDLLKLRDKIRGMVPDGLGELLEIIIPSLEWEDMRNWF
ncbi:hypothetical protein BDN72DRAFT_843357, partial [Pluteus cervinus]